MPNLQTFPQQEKAKKHSCSGLRQEPPSKKSAKVCKSLQIMQTFVVRSRLSSTATTRKMTRNQQHPNRTKSIVFAKKSLPDFVVTCYSLTTYGNPRSSLFRTFSQNLRKISFPNNAKRMTYSSRNFTPEYPPSQQIQHGFGNSKCRKTFRHLRAEPLPIPEYWQKRLHSTQMVGVEYETSSKRHIEITGGRN